MNISVACRRRWAAGASSRTIPFIFVIEPLRSRCQIVEGLQPRMQGSKCIWTTI